MCRPADSESRASHRRDQYTDGAKASSADCVTCAVAAVTRQVSYLLGVRSQDCAAGRNVSADKPAISAHSVPRHDRRGPSAAATARAPRRARVRSTRPAVS